MRVEGTGDAIIHRGDPRIAKSDIDSWYNGLLGSVQPATARPWLYGSDAGLCARKNVFYSQNDSVPFIMQPSTRTYMAIGVALENLLAEALKDAGRLIAQNPYLIAMPEVKVRGKIDLVIFDMEDELALVEVKSCGELPTEPNPQHLAQIQTYCAISGVHRAYLTYISRKVQGNSSWGPNVDIRSFRVDTDKDSLYFRLYTVALSDLAIKEKKLPLINPTFRKTLECRYCPFLNYCWRSEPRYGGEEPEDSGIESFSIEEEVRVSDRANTVAMSLLKESSFRRDQSIKGWINSLDRSSPLINKLISFL